MLDLNELKHLVLFAEYGTLSRVAEACHISTPSITRSMKHLEECFGVSLFIREKSKIKLNETGYIAVEAARNILAETDKQLHSVQEFDRNQKTISVLSCAPAPLWDAIPNLTSLYPDKNISSQLTNSEKIIEEYENGNVNFAFLPYSYKNFVPCLTEQLFLSVKKGHEFSEHKYVYFSELNGLNFLIRSKIGFWDKLCHDKLPASRFLVQKDEFEFSELVKTSSLPCFATDIGVAHGFSYEDRILIPIKDAEATVTFYTNSKL